MAKLTDDELLRVVEDERTAAIGNWYGSLSGDRQKALAYYNGQPYGNEVEGRSQFVTRDVLEVVEYTLPSLMRIFASGDEVVKFEPRMPDDVDKANQATDYINWIFQSQNNGFVTLYAWFKDALLQKNGFIKVYWDDYEEVKKESYRGLTDVELAMLQQGPGVEILAHSSYPAPANGIMAQPEMLHDVDIKITNKSGKCCIECIPPEEILVARDTRMDIQKSRYVAHRKKTNPSELKEMGFSEEDIEELQSDDNNDYNQEHLERWKLENDFTSQNYQPADESMRPIWITEAYIRVDYDGDGIAELRKVIHVGNKILDNEEIDHIPIVTLTPIIMPHKLFGMSEADLAMDIQLLKSTVTRQILDNMYLQNNGRWMALDGMVNMDDLLTSRPGGVVRVKTFDAVKRLDSPMLGAPAFNLLEYIDTIKENRTGITKYNQGLDSDSLNKTAHGISLIQNASQQRIELIARVFAETGVKNLFSAILELVSKYQNKAQVVRLRGQWVNVDPRDWADKFDMSVTVGLGNGNKEQEAQAIQEIIKLQIGAIQMGLPIATPENVYAAAEKLKASIGQKNSNFFTDPKTVQPPPPKQNPKIEEIQAQAHAEAQLKIVDARIQQQMPKDNQAQIQAEAQMRSDQMKLSQDKYAAELKAHTEQIKADSLAAIEAQKREFEAWRAKLEADTKILVANIAASTTLKSASISAKSMTTGDEEGNETASDPMKDMMGGVMEVVEKSFAGMMQANSENTKAILDSHGKSLQSLTKKPGRRLTRVSEGVWEETPLG